MTKYKHVAFKCMTECDISAKRDSDLEKSGRAISRVNCSKQGERVQVVYFNKLIVVQEVLLILASFGRLYNTFNNFKNYHVYIFNSCILIFFSYSGNMRMMSSHNGVNSSAEAYIILSEFQKHLDTHKAFSYIRSCINNMRMITVALYSCFD